MRARGNEGRLGRRFAIVIGLAAAGVMALGAQTATSTTGPVDRFPPDLRLSGAKTQNPQSWRSGICERGRCHVYVRVSCGDQACTARATGRVTKVKEDKEDKLGPARWDLDPGQTAALGLNLSLQTRNQARKALAEGKKVRAKVTVRARDAAGNVATRQRTIRLVK